MTASRCSSAATAPTRCLGRTPSTPGMQGTRAKISTFFFFFESRGHFFSARYQMMSQGETLSFTPTGCVLGGSVLDSLRSSLSLVTISSLLPLVPDVILIIPYGRWSLQWSRRDAQSERSPAGFPFEVYWEQTALLCHDTPVLSMLCAWRLVLLHLFGFISSAHRWWRLFFFLSTWRWLNSAFAFDTK